MGYIRRREFLSGGAAAVSLPFMPKAGFAADTDVVIVGAGAAGLGAAHVFKEKGISFKLLEAKNRIGGRAVTDTEKFGKPFDLGCTFQHQADKNPFVDYARKNGFKIGPLPPDEQSLIWVGRSEASGRQYNAIDSQYKKMEAAIIKAGQSGLDISLAEAAAKVPETRYDRMIAHWLISEDNAEKKSILDWWNGADGDDYLAPAGYGTIVQHYGRSIPVELNTIVSSIDWSGSGVKITTDRGTVTAKHCIVTVSNGVLASEQIRINPVPKKRQEVVNGIPLTNYATIGLQFKRKNILPTKRNAWFFHVNKNDNSSMTWVEDIGGSGVVRGNVYGDVAKNLEMKGEKALINHAVEELKYALGSNSVPEVINAKASMWSQDRFTLGTWSSAKPGFGSKRYILRRSVAERLHFAGEACHGNMYSTCHGAMLSGREVAGRISLKLQ